MFNLPLWYIPTADGWRGISWKEFGAILIFVLILVLLGLALD
jgi:hypothetical protein